MIWGISIVLLVLLVYVISLYNRLVNDKNTVMAAWSDIDVQLKRRHELIPKLVDAVKTYASYEQTTLTRVTELREQGRKLQGASAGEVGRVEGQLTQALHGLLAVAESYPELKTSEQFSGLQDEISNVEDAIQYARRYYNGAVKAYNVAIESFPSNLVARLFGFRQAEYFEWASL